MISIVDQIDEYVALMDEPREPDGLYHPSAMWRCARRVLYELRGEAPSDPHDARARRRFLVGHVIHDVVREAVMSAPDVVAVHAEFEVSGERLVGHGDLLLELEDGSFIVVEVKSMSKMRKLEDRDAHQGMTYAVSVRMQGFASRGVWHAPLGDRLKGVVVLYVDKSNLTIREHYLPYDQAWETEIADRIAHLDRYGADPQSLPPKLPAPKGKRAPECFTCPFAARCRRDGAGRPVAA